MKFFTFNKERLKNIYSFLGWFLFYLAFLLAGSLSITKIEEKHDIQIKTEKRNNFLNVLIKYNLSVNNSMIKEIVKAATHAKDVGALNFNNFNEEIKTSWNIGTGIFFCSTIITTIGYGNLTPRSFNGRLFVIFFALIGIPITGVLLTKVAIALTSVLKKCDNILATVIPHFIARTKEENLKKYIRTTQLVAAILIFVLCFLVLPSYLISSVIERNWDFMTAFYFCFISLTTIGLGDVVLGTSNQGYDVSLENMKVITLQLSLLVYLILGLSALSIILNLLISLLRMVADATLKTTGNIASNHGQIITSSGKRLMNSIGKRFHSKNNQVYPSSVNDEETHVDGNSFAIHDEEVKHEFPITTNRKLERADSRFSFSSGVEDNESQNWNSNLRVALKRDLLHGPIIYIKNKQLQRGCVDTDDSSSGEESHLTLSQDEYIFKKSRKQEYNQEIKQSITPPTLPPESDNESRQSITPSSLQPDYNTSTLPPIRSVTPVKHPNALPSLPLDQKLGRPVTPLSRDLHEYETVQSTLQPTLTSHEHVKEYITSTATPSLPSHLPPLSRKKRRHKKTSIYTLPEI